MVPSGSQSQYQTDAAFCFSVAFSGVKSLAVTMRLNAHIKTAQQHHTGVLRTCAGLLEAALHDLLLLSSLFLQ